VILFGLAWHFAARRSAKSGFPRAGHAANYYRDAFWIALGGSRC